ncbi:TPA: VPA1337 family putative T3SS effector [Vibrio parahaemolyticus]|nr:VPA1337 family putative T3SS effector [Vibrio parahaemolyticus]EJE4701610.1 VPA1337 family putative T3SS effector [Vibrio parahaemolyticus]EJG1803662.1 VPA1337 family putative T3SS effector [Vibrio parahaemolyticus]ELA7420520.1 VPA1337 family putative T3SS effector [Vibrio parahaemolyticus]ELA9555382.1 VPA1337 family putative T3SS effector [Vibrio parahaemolyticus]MCC3859336.1 VPA1337 family putative T3SS effector [Vibrio parahaemolyticus]
MSQKWEHIEYLQFELNTISLKNEQDSLKRLFIRREGLRSQIESTFYDISVIKQDLNDVMFEIHEVLQEKKNLEKRKDRLTEMREQLMYE